MKIILFISLFIFAYQSCDQLDGTVGLVSICATSKEKGLGTAITDNVIKTKFTLVNSRFIAYLISFSTKKFLS